MPPTSPGEQPPGRLARLRAALRAVSLVQWVLVTMLGVGGLAFLRAFARGERVDLQRLAWGALAWTFPLLWDVTAVIGSTLWIAAPRGTAAFRWGVFLNLGATIVSGLATGSQSYTLARDTLPGGWPVPAFLAGFAVPVIYSILTWAAASAREALEVRWSAPTPSTASAAATASASSATAAPESRGALATASPTSPDLLDPRTEPTPLPEPSATASLTATSPAALSSSPTLDEVSPSTSTGDESAPAEAPPSTGDLDLSPAPSPSEESAPTPSPSGPTPPPPDDSAGMASTPSARKEWAVAELLRRAEAPGATELRPRDIDAEFGTKDGWRVLPQAREAVAAGYEPATAGAER